jgi:sulfate/thiosulfate-binding protein
MTIILNMIKTLIYLGERTAMDRIHTLIAIVLAATPFLSGCNSSHADSAGDGSHELLNVSYDPTRELWKALNEQFIADYKQHTGVELTINQSHAGSSNQARSVIDGLEADVVTLAMWSDTNAIAKAGLIKEGWEDRLPNGSLPYTSTIVFVVRKGNPKQIKDWSDLVREGVQVITPNPKTSGNGKLSLLSAWGSVVLRGGSEKDAIDYITRLYGHDHLPVLESGARAATTTFAQKGLGDVHLTWENEAYFEVRESGDELEIVYPPISIRAEPRVAVVDANVDRKHTRAAAEAYLKFLYTPAAQETIAKNYYRPSKPEILHKYSKSFQPIELFTIQQIAPNWSEADARFFSEGGIFDQVYSPTTK